MQERHYTGELVTTFKERLNQLCDESASTDTEIAKMLDVPKQTLSAWKLGTRSPKTTTAETIAKRLGVSAEWLLGFDVPKKLPPPDGSTSSEGKISQEQIEEMLVSLGLIVPGEDLSDADTRFILSVGKALQTWFAERK